MNSQTFRVQMAVGSWAYPRFDQMVGIVKSEMGECEEENVGIELEEDIWNGFDYVANIVDMYHSETSAKLVRKSYEYVNLRSVGIQISHPKAIPFCWVWIATVYPDIIVSVSILYLYPWLHIQMYPYVSMLVPA